MTLTPEQFNKLALKEDLNVLKKELKEDIRELMTKEDKNEILNAIDQLAQKASSTEDEKTANQGAHDRIQGDVNEVREHVGLNIKNPILDTGNI